MKKISHFLLVGVLLKAGVSFAEIQSPTVAIPATAISATGFSPVPGVQYGDDSSLPGNGPFADANTLREYTFTLDSPTGFSNVRFETFGYAGNAKPDIGPVFDPAPEAGFNPSLLLFDSNHNLIAWALDWIDDNDPSTPSAGKPIRSAKISPVQGGIGDALISSDPLDVAPVEDENNILNLGRALENGTYHLVLAANENNWIASTSSWSNTGLTDNSGAPNVWAIGFKVENATAPGANLSLSPSALDFGDVAINSVSAAKAIVVTNTGSASLTISDVALPSGAFALDSGNCKNSTLAKNASCQISYKFSPTSVGLQNSSITINSNDADQPATTINLTGTGTSGSISLSASALAFADVPVNQVSSTQELTVSNVGKSTLTISSVSLPGAPFNKVSDTCQNATLATGASCKLSYSFAPMAVGSQSGTVDIASNDPVHPSTSVALTGNGTGTGQAVLSLTPDQVNFGDVIVNQTANQDITLTNTGSAPLTIAGVSAISSGDFLKLSDQCTSQVLAAGATCKLSYQFAPQAVAPQTANVLVTSNVATNGSISFSLNGNGIAVPVGSISLSSNQLSFANVAIGANASQQLTISNTGVAPLQISAIAPPSGAFALAEDACSDKTLAVGQSCTVAYQFKPTLLGVQSTSITINSNDAQNKTLFVSLSGTGVAAPAGILTVSASQLDFGTVDTTQPLSKELTLSNTGTAALTINSVSAVAAPFSKLTDSCSGQVLAPEQSCTLAYQFAPMVTDQDVNELQTIDIGSTDPANSNTTLILRGTGTSTQVLKFISFLNPDVAVSEPITINGSGFTAKKGVVYWGSTKLPILKWTNTQIVVKLPTGTAAVSNSFKIVTKSKPNNPITTAPITLHKPEVQGLSVAAGKVGSILTIQGQYFGVAVKPKVYIGLANKKLKQLPVLAGSTSNSLRIKMPKLKPKNYVIWVSSSAGIADNKPDFQVLR